MGANESKKESSVKIENNTFTINRTDINVLNKTVQNISNSVINNIMNQHSSSLQATNRLRISNTSFIADKDIEISQKNEGSIKITTEFINTIITTLQTDIATTLTSAIENNISQDIMSKMMNKLDEHIKDGWGNLDFGIGNKSSESDLTDITSNIEITNDTHMDLQNIVELVVNSEINNDISNQCMTDILLHNGIDIEMSDFIAKGNIRLNQANTFNVVSECIANNEIISSITDKLTQIFDVHIKEDKQSTATTDTTSDKTKIKENQGIGDAASEIVDSVGDTGKKLIDSAGDTSKKLIDSAGGAVSNIFSGMTWIFIIIGIVLIAAIIGIVIFLNSSAGQEITKKVADKGLSKFGGCNDNFIHKLIKSDQ